MKHNYTYAYKRVFLRPLEEKDIEELRVLRNKNRQFFDTATEITPERQKAWFDRYLEKENDYMLALELVSNPGEFVGAIAIYNIDWEAGTAEVGRTVIDKEKAPERGLGTELSIAAWLLTFSLGIKEGRGYMHKNNAAAIKMNERVGCQIIGEHADSWDLRITPDTLNLSD